MKQHYYRRYDQSFTTQVSEATLRHDLATTFNSDPSDGSFAEREGHWMVIGKIQGDDEGSALSVYASSEAAAIFAFLHRLEEERDFSLDENSDDHAEVFVDATLRSDSPIYVVSFC